MSNGDRPKGNLVVTRDVYTASGDLVHALCFTEAGNAAVYSDTPNAELEACRQRIAMPGYRVRVFTCPVL